MSKATALLEKLPWKHARQISNEISINNHVTPQGTSRIGQSLLAQFDNLHGRAFALSSEERVISILKATKIASLDDVKDDLDESDCAFANRVQQLMLALKDIHKRLHPSDISQITGIINTVDLPTAPPKYKKPRQLLQEPSSLKTCFAGRLRTNGTILPIWRQTNMSELRRLWMR